MSTFLYNAEAGIRGGHVTGVQTCALPIYTRGLDVARWSSTTTSPSGPTSTPTADRFSRLVTGQIGRASWREGGRIAVRGKGYQNKDRRSRAMGTRKECGPRTK